MASPLDGIILLDVTGMGPASVATMHLGDMGADVIKIDMPPRVGGKGVGQGLPWVETTQPLPSNRNKKNLALDLKTEEGRRIFCDLAKTADVIVEAFRPGVMEGFGLGYETIAEINPRLIYCSLSGYGQDGPYRNFPAHDPNCAGMGGVLGLIGHDADSCPVMPLNIAADMAVGVYQTINGILLAICARERTGRGQLVDISLNDGVVGLLSGIPGPAQYLSTGVIPQRGETMLSGTEPYCAVYETKDNKYITISPIEPHFWRNMCHALGRDDLIPHQFAPKPKKDEVFSELQAIFSTKARDEWFDLLINADVPVGKVLNLDEVFSDPQVLHRQMVIEVDHPESGKVKQIGFSIKLSDTPGQIRSLPVGLGQNTEELLTGLGYSKSEIERLRHEKVI